MTDSAAKSPYGPWDPVFIHSRREAIVIFCVWLVGLIWAVPFCYYNGYPQQVVTQQDVDAGSFADGEQPEVTFTTTLGVPTWLFWGIAVPWVVANVITTLFCFFFMKEDDLGDANEEGEPGGDGSAAKEGQS